MDCIPGEDQVRIFDLRIGTDQSIQRYAKALGNKIKRIALLHSISLPGRARRYMHPGNIDYISGEDQVRILDLRISLDQGLQRHAKTLGNKK